MISLSLKLFFVVKNYILLVFFGTRSLFKNILLLSSGDNFYLLDLESDVFCELFFIADCFAHVSASWCKFSCPTICIRVDLLFLIVVGFSQFHLLLTALNG